jgi:hypothetical protein
VSEVKKIPAEIISIVGYSVLRFIARLKLESATAY